MLKTLKGKFTLLISSIIIISTTIGGFLNGFNNPLENIFLMILLPIILIGFSTLLINLLLNPLNELSKGLENLSSGQVQTHFNIHSSDELEKIAQALNQMAQKIAEVVSKEQAITNQAITAKGKVETVLSSLVDGVIVLNLHRQVIMVNKAAEQLTNYTNQEMVGQLIDNLIKVKDSNDKVIPPINYCAIDLSGQQITPQTLTSVKTIGKNNIQNQLQIISAPIISGIQSDLGCVLILHNHAQEKNLEQMQVDFVSMASHEIRTPLTSIVNYLSVLTEEASSKLTAEQQTFLKNAFDSAKQLVTLVNNLLNVSKVERGTFSVIAQTINWQQEIIKIVADNQVQAKQKHIILSINIPQSLPQVKADKMRIEEVLNNLINNAINYTDPNGTIEVGAKTSSNEVITYVKDSGRGIPKEAIPHLFTKFFRVEGIKEANYKGTGLGLYISKSIIDLHHGKIWVESELNKGSTFYFSLPIVQNNSQDIMSNFLTNLGPTIPTSL